MKLTIVALYSEYLGAFDLPQFLTQLPENIGEGYRRSILQDPDGAFKAHVHEKKAYLLGFFDDEAGTFELLPEKKLICDLAPMFPRGYIQAHTRSEEDGLAF